MARVHLAITRQVKPGCEREFEQALREFARESLREPGTCGVQLIEPVPGTDGCEYGILRSFDSEAASREFYKSELFKQWQQRAAPMVVGEAVRRRLHGLEAFFRDTRRPPPPRWKMAVATWLGVYPTVLLWSSLLPELLPGVPHLVMMAIVITFSVITLTWGLMPLLTKLLARWLHGTR